MKSYRVYIVQCNDQSYYIGITNNLEKRILEHNHGIYQECYTFKRRPCRGVYSEEYHDINDAITREKQLKKRTRKKKEALIQGNLDKLPNLSTSRHGSTSSPGQNKKKKQLAYLALSSSKGDREGELQRALTHLQTFLHDITYSKIYRTTPLGSTAGKNFLNIVIRGHTNLLPLTLLETCQGIEQRMGRKKKASDVERNIDIDILFYEQEIIQTEDLIIPHPRYHERDFTIMPLIDIDPDRQDPITGKKMVELQSNIQHTTILSSYSLHMPQQYIVGVLNISPDSFSDGRERTKDDLHQRILELIAAGADIIDIGGESTAPGSSPVSIQDELDCLQEIFSLIQENNYPVKFSLDTMKAGVAKVGIEQGVDMINDVSGGRCDPDMFSVIAEAGIPYVIMYCKNPTGRADVEDISYDDIIQHIGDFLEQQIETALAAGVQREQLILDPGMGAFVSANPADSVAILQQLDQVKNRFQLPIFVCTSRKGFHKKITPDKGATDRIGSSLASSRFALQQGVDYIRVHDVKAMRQFMDVYAYLEK